MSTPQKGDPEKDLDVKRVLKELEKEVEGPDDMRNLDMETLKQLHDVTSRLSAAAVKYMVVRLEQSTGALKGQLNDLKDPGEVAGEQ